MSMDCEMLGALLSERRRGELGPEEARALEEHLAGCPRCRSEAHALEAVLAAVELPPVSAAEIEALRARRIAEPPQGMSGRRSWSVPAALMAAAAAAILTISVHPGPRHHPERVTAPAPLEADGELAVAGDTQELFPELGSDTGDDTMDTFDDEAVSFESPGLFGNLDD